MNTFRKVEIIEFEFIYNSWMINDFPENELKKLDHIKEIFKQGKYECIVMEEDGQIKAYACFLWLKPTVKILDYLAVVSDTRGKGYGSQLLNWLKEGKGKSEIIVESEDPNFTVDDKEKIIRERRISFYEKNGLMKRKFSLKLSEVEFNILTFEDSQLDKKMLLNEMLAIYSEFSPILKVTPY